MFEILQGKGGPAAISQRASKLSGLRGAALALVFLALASLSLRSFCDLAFDAAASGNIAPAVTTTGHGVAGNADFRTLPSEACCANIADGTLVKPAESLVPWTPDVSLGAAFIVLAGLLPVAGSRNAARVRFAALPERSFYIRSARILR